jgi:hypothetical protein
MGEDLFDMDESELEESAALGALTLEMDLGEDDTPIEPKPSEPTQESTQSKGEPSAQA